MTNSNPPTLEEAYDIFQHNLPPMPIEFEVNFKIVFYAGARAVFDLVNYAAALPTEDAGLQIYKSINTSLQQEGS